MKRLTALKVQAIKDAGMCGDGQGLYLNVATGGAKGWILGVTVRGQAGRREYGLGSLDTLPFSEARIRSGIAG